VGIESTVVSVIGSPPLLLRPGMITVAQIEAEVGVLGEATTSSGVAHPSPGLHPKHYSPRTPVLIAGRDAVPADARLAHLDAATLPAAELYATLHRLDDEGYDAILVNLPPDTPEWAAVRDRLTRAAER
jgi:L-threonylcarbamoyladenylate synthase